MRLNLYSIGKTDQKEIQQLITYYTERFPRHWNFDSFIIPDLKGSKNLTSEQIKKMEGQEILRLLDPSDYLVLLDEKGKHYTSRDFAGRLGYWEDSSFKRIILLIGGAWGFSPEIYARAQEKLSLSQMTFTHQMVRLFLVEQLFRADAILRNRPYHND